MSAVTRGIGRNQCLSAFSSSSAVSTRTGWPGSAALGYELAPTPAGFATWNDFHRELGVPEKN